MGRRTITALAVISLAIAGVQLTPLRFLPVDAVDFVWGFAGGVSIGAIVTWFAARS
jgi:hypothetical protein